jgi:peptide/nickel transport system substrate-binding protein
MRDAPGIERTSELSPSNLPGAMHMLNLSRGRWLVAALVLALLPQPSPGLQRNESHLVVADATAPPTLLDPFKVYGTQAQSLFRLIYAPLFDRDPDGKIVAPLLEGRETPVDPLTWEFRLRRGIRFHDGIELTSSDVVFSLQRILDPQVASPRRRDFEDLAKIEAVDPVTFRITTRQPYALLPARLSQFSMILPDRLRGRSEADFFREPVGLGPFRLAELNAEHAILTAFPEYFAGPPRISRIVFPFIADPAERLRRLLEGKVDLVTNLLPQQVDAVKRARGVRLLKRPSIRLMDIILDTTRGALAKVEVRQALRYGTDVESLIKYVARGNGTPLATTVLPGDVGFDSSLRPYPFNPGKARSLLAEAGYPQGLRLRGMTTHDTRTIATAVAQQWAKIGVVLEVEADGRAAAMARWIKERDRYDFMVWDPTSILFDASFHLRLHIDPGHSMGRSPHPRALELLNRSDAESNRHAREALLREVQAIAYEQALVLPLYNVIDLYGVRDRVKGFAPSADTILRLAGVSVGP